MPTIRQLIQTSPAKANELFAKLAETSGNAVKTRERLFSELKEELELQMRLRRVDGFDDDEAKSECDEGCKVLVRFLATERNALEALELADEVFDAGAGAIERLREERRPVLGR